ncbi:hypothetical protein BJ875DRAFT_153131 [Amylocarpus encephaloides]|uniref:Uncharacterized protein n=1 Tax=Amylocarpus encephaloides TaxID=45428 RepID=A0A9P7YPQ9_9HELO|nr:hypothetical protein BJ875DRAFT_153131 [Amylocarpus encephaloides]
MVSALSFIADLGWMILLQFILLKAQHFYQRNPRNRPLTSFEKCIIAMAFWVVFHVGRFAIGLVLRVFGVLFATSDDSHHAGLPIRPDQPTSSFGAIAFKVLATWVIHKGVNFLLNTVVPLWEEVSCDSDKVRRRFKARAVELLEGTREFTQGKGLMSRLIHDRATVMRERDASISLERHRVDNPGDGQRTLDWNVVIEKSALDEMKESLGPPGGFGEMGFNVSADGVCFEAMGVGTRFNLKFSVKQTVVQPRKKGRSI